MDSVLIDSIKGIMERVNTRIEKMEKIDAESPIICFRGENKDFGKTKLTPTLFRNDDIASEKNLLDLLSDYNISSDENLLARAIDGQHFIQISRLLDITFNLLPALYFATENESEDGRLFIFSFPESFSPNSAYMKEYYSNLVNGDIVPYFNDFKVISHSYGNERIRSQDGGFLLFSGKRYHPIPEEYFDEITIKKDKKSAIRHELSTYFNINAATLYPEKENRGKLIGEKIRQIKITSLSDTDHGKAEIFNHINRVELEFYLRESEEKYSKNDLKKYLRMEKSNMVDYINRYLDDEDNQAVCKKEIENRLALLDWKIK